MSRRKKTTWLRTLGGGDAMTTFVVLLLVLLLGAWWWLRRQWQPWWWYREGLNGGGGGIPQVMMQTSKVPMDPLVVADLRERLGSAWTHIHFTDADIMAYFAAHPLPEFPHMAAKFRSIAGGAHRADLFRYYFLFINGGVFMDSDAKLMVNNLTALVQQPSFFTVYSINPGTIFNGFIGCSPGHPIMHELLADAYAIDVDLLVTDYLLICRNGYDILALHSKEAGDIKMFQERLDDSDDSVSESDSPDSEVTASTLDDDGTVVLVHHFTTKQIPLSINK